MIMSRFCWVWVQVLLLCANATSNQPRSELDTLPPFIHEAIAARSSLQETSDRLVFGRSDGVSGVIAPKFMIVSVFAPEAAVWPQPLGLFANNVTIPGLSPLFPAIFCDKAGKICQVVTGEGEINAANSMSSLVASPLFNLTKTYFMVAAIGGVNPTCGTTGGVNLARYAVQVALQDQIDPRELTKNYTANSGYIPLGQNAPDTYPIFLYGTEVFEMSTSLRDRAFTVMQKAKLADSSTARQYRKRYPDAPANQPPTVFQGTIETSDVFWHGALLGNSFAEYTRKLTNGTGRYCMTASEDNAILSSLLRGALFQLVDFGRIISMRTAANFDRPPPGDSAATSLFFDNSGGFPISVSNIFIAGIEFVHDVINNWDSVYEAGIPLENYIGDIFGSLKGPFKPDIGSPNSQVG